MSPVLICAAVSSLLSEHKEALKQKVQGPGLMELSGELSRVPGNQNTSAVAAAWLRGDVLAVENHIKCCNDGVSACLLWWR